MSFEMRGEAVAAAHDLDELKLVFRALHGVLPRYPELLDSHFMAELQTFLHAQAQRDGVDIADHSAWDRWLDSRSATGAGVRPAGAPLPPARP